MRAPLRDEDLQPQQQKPPQPPLWSLQYPTMQLSLPVAIVMQTHIQLPP